MRETTAEVTPKRPTSGKKPSQAKKPSPPIPVRSAPHLPKPSSTAAAGECIPVFIAWLQAVPLMLHALNLSHMNTDQERVAVQYIPVRSSPCRCVRLEPGCKSLITPPLRDMARHITRGGVITNTYCGSMESHYLL